MNVLFLHSNFPGQFGLIAERLHAEGQRCIAISSRTGRGLPGIRLLRWATSRGTTEGIFPLAVRAEADLIRGSAAAECMLKLKAQGFRPDLVIGHPGWGETLFARQIFPAARQVLYGEFYYGVDGSDVGFDPEFGELTIQDRLRCQAKNATLALALVDAHRIVCPTPFQASRLSEIFRARASIIHEGVDVDRVRADPAAKLQLGDGRILDRSIPVITFINRRFEPLRGFHVFVRALPRILAKVPKAHVVIIGADEPAGYGLPAPRGTTWKRHFMAEVEHRLDMSRVHFTGRVPYHKMLAALSISAAHVYYTYPFVLSWSLLEAMACECLVIASNTAPVRDVIEHEVNGLLLDFFDVDALAETVIEACRKPHAFSPLRSVARATVLEQYDRKGKCEPAWMALIADLLSKPV